MPRLSIVVTVRRSRGNLRACLESVLGQSYADIEVIGVDDGSPDGAGKLLDEFAARDSRVRAVHLPGAVGPGGRRNAGAELARGDYVLFLDGNFVQLPGALRAIAGRLAEAGDPDLLLFGHLRRPFRGTARPARSLEILRSVTDPTCTLADRPHLLDVARVSWNRALRRDFLLAERLLFDPDQPGESMYALKSLAVASSVACLPQPCVEHRQQRHLPALVEPLEGPPAPRRTVGAYDGLLTFLEARPRLRPLRPLLFDAAARDLLSTYSRVRNGRRAYVRAVARFDRAHRPDGFHFPPGRHGLRLRLLTRGRRSALAALDGVLALRRLLRSAPGAARARARRRLAGRYYWLQRRFPLDRRLAVYAAYWHRGVSCNPAAVHRKALELAPDIRGVWVVAKDAVASVPPGIDYVVPGTRRYWSLLARATYFINNVNFPDHLVKRPGQIHVMTHHGTPLKIMGLDQQQYPAAAQGLNFTRLLRRVDRWDLSISANPHSTETWSRAYPGAAVRHIETGYPRNDIFATSSPEQIRAIRDGLGIRPGQRAILYAPTHRDYEKSFVCRLDLDRFCRKLGPDTVVLVRAHYFYGDGDGVAGGLPVPEHESVIDVSTHPRVEELCLAADALVTDYSSVMFDYAGLDRPIVVHAPDWATYRSVRGVCFDLLSGSPGDTPGAVSTSTDDLVRIFRDGVWNSPENNELRRAFRARFCPYDDGHAAERVVRAVFLSPAVPPSRRPDRSPPGTIRPTSTETSARAAQSRSPARSADTRAR